jgi:predicted  nucleic acid-binding Zn-ribbon protein
LFWKQKDELLNLNQEMASLKDRNLQLESEKSHAENKRSLMEKNLQSFLKVIDPKISHLGVEELNLEEEKREVEPADQRHLAEQRHHPKDQIA